MFIRQTKTNASASGKAYFTYRLVESRRVGERVSQRTVLNLGRNFDIPRELWPDLCSRIDQILDGENPLFPLDKSVEQKAQHIYAQILALRAGSTPASEPPQTKDFQEIDVNSIGLIKPRSVGAEHASLEALNELGLPGILDAAGLNGRQKSAALGNIIGRMCAPASELATHRWLQDKSALGELLAFDFQAMPAMQLYRASDLLLKHKSLIEERLFENAQSLFGFTPTITLYDLTNTYFEGGADANPKAKRGRSKEKRSDCPLVTLGLALDASGFVRHSETFEGNVSEAGTLEEILKTLGAPKGALIIMDAGIASEENLQWLAGEGYKYLAVSRERKREFDREKASSIESATGHQIWLQRDPGNSDDEIKLRCHSEQRAEKDSAINESFRQKFEAELGKLAAGLTKPHCTKKRDKINERLGRLKQRYQRVGQHYRIELDLDDKQDTVTAIRWSFEPVQNSKHSHPGVYTLRCNQTGWADEKLWRTYTMLTDLEAVFRSLKSELGLRPVYHHKEDRCELKESGTNESWKTLREVLETQQRVTVTFQQKDGRTMHVRKSTAPEEALKNVYEVRGLEKNPGGIKKMTI